MPDAVLAILMALAEFQRGAKLFQIVAVSGYEAGTFHRVCVPLLNSKWMGCIRYRNEYWITERGKIAVAIEIGRRSRARSEGRKHRRVCFREFANVAA